MCVCVNFGVNEKLGKMKTRMRMRRWREKALRVSALEEEEEESLEGFAISSSMQITAAIFCHRYQDWSD